MRPPPHRSKSASPPSEAQAARRTTRQSGPLLPPPDEQARLLRDAQDRRAARQAQARFEAMQNRGPPLSWPRYWAKVGEDRCFGDGTVRAPQMYGKWHQDWRMVRWDEGSWPAVFSAEWDSCFFALARPGSYRSFLSRDSDRRETNEYTEIELRLAPDANSTLVGSIGPITTAAPADKYRFVFADGAVTLELDRRYGNLPELACTGEILHDSNPDDATMSVRLVAPGQKISSEDGREYTTQPGDIELSHCVFREGSSFVLLRHMPGALPGAAIAFALVVRAGPPHLRLPAEIAAAVWECSLTPEQPSDEIYTDEELREMAGKHAFCTLSWTRCSRLCGMPACSDLPLLLDCK